MPILAWVIASVLESLFSACEKLVCLVSLLDVKLMAWSSTSPPDAMNLNVYSVDLKSNALPSFRLLRMLSYR